jgi:hypothetical protein
MPHFNVAKAVRSNPIYGRHVRWIHRFGEVIAALGCKPDSAVAFAECVAAWQGANGLKSDGMLGPKTWTKLKRAIPYGAPMLPAPEWLRLSPEAEGWIDAIVATLKDDTTFLSLSHGAHSVKHKDFTDIAEFIADGTIEVVPVNSRGASYEFRNTEADADSLKTPRRSSGPWRVTQALVIHEAVHAISDLRLRGVEVLTLDEEAFAQERGASLGGEVPRRGNRDRPGLGASPRSHSQAPNLPPKVPQEAQVRRPPSRLSLSPCCLAPMPGYPLRLR